MGEEKAIKKKKYRPEIEGIRVVAALLVAIYHIWLGKVSGGVDVFFVVSGFLITASLISMYLREGYIRFFKFIFGLLKRLLPAAFTVLMVTVILSFFFLPSIHWGQTIKEVIASALYFENWRLAIDSVDYLDKTNPQSPVQHYWAMSIQGQFYIIWFIIFSLAIFLTKKFQLNLKNILVWLFSILFIVSFIFSLYQTEVNQPFAYFDTRARVFEFAMGGLLFLFIDRILLLKKMSFIIGWVGLTSLILCGALLEVSTIFPGYIALWPTLSAIMILLAGENPSRFGVEKLLGHPIMVKLGSYSYGFYLWHWVVLVFYQYVYDNEVNLAHGLMIMLFSIVLSYLTTEFVEKPIRKVKSNRAYLKRLSPILVVLILSFSYWLLTFQSQQVEAEGVVVSESHPGALLQFDQYKNYDRNAALVPSLAFVKEDLAETYDNGCNQMGTGTTAKHCYAGDEDAKTTIALVGGSHSAHWYSALDEFQKKYEDISVLNVTKSACRFTTDFMSKDCSEWNDNVIDLLEEKQPDLVVTMADVGHPIFPEVPEGYLEQFEKLENMDIPIMAIRDNPWFEFDAPECISENEEGNEECKIKRSEVLPEPSKWEQVKGKPTNVNYVDYSDHYCDEDYCYPTKGNVIIYMDENHFTSTFVKTLTPFLEEDLLKILSQHIIDV